MAEQGRLAGYSDPQRADHRTLSPASFLPSLGTRAGPPEAAASRKPPGLAVSYAPVAGTASPPTTTGTRPVLNHTNNQEQASSTGYF